MSYGAVSTSLVTFIKNSSLTYYHTVPYLVYFFSYITQIGTSTTVTTITKQIYLILHVIKEQKEVYKFLPKPKLIKHLLVLNILQVLLEVVKLNVNNCLTVLYAHVALKACGTSSSIQVTC